MNHFVRITGIVCTFMILSDAICLAGSAGMLGMSNTRQENVSHTTFVFDQIPEFEVTHSGQRVRVELANTDVSDSFQEISQKQLLPPLVEVKMHTQGRKSIVDLYYRDIPEFVDVTVDDRYARFTVNVFWDRLRAGSRPGILDQRFGRLKPIHHGAAAEKIIFSDYAGKWKEFFADFEWVPEWDLPVSVSLPPFPSPLVMENRAFLPDALIEPIMGGLWDEVESRITALLQEDTNGEKAGLYRLILAELLLRQKEYQQVTGVVEQIVPNEQQPQANAWRTYFQIHAAAGASEYHQAASIAESSREELLDPKQLAPWFAILGAEIYLAIGEPEQALHELDRDLAYTGAGLAVATLRRGDAQYGRGQADAAFESYSKVASDLRLMQQYPGSLARYTSLLYRNRLYEKAYRYWFLLSERLKKKASAHQPLADYWGAMARFHAGDVMQARLMLWELEKEAGNTEAGHRARLKLMDLEVVENSDPDFDALLPAYDSLIEASDKRQIREEAFFKQILACHLGGNDLAAIRQLGRFFDSYWAGQLQPEAQALFAEIFPAAVREMVAQNKHFEALTLVAKHRDLLAHARITYGFLYDLAESYTKAGLLEQAAAAYLYLMDFEKEQEQQMRVYLPLIRTFDRQGNHDQARRYAADYLDRFPDGADRLEVFFHYARSLAQNGDVGAAARMLRENKRPIHEKADLLAGNLFFDQEQYELAACYLGRAAAMAHKENRAAIDFKRAEALFALDKWEQAAPLYERILGVEPYSGQAAYRLIQAYLQLGRENKALNIYRQLSEMKTGDPWMTLSAQTIEIENQGN